MVRQINPPVADEVVAADAANRGVRTFWQGLLFDVGLAVLLTVGPLLVSSDFAFTRVYWLLVSTAAAKSVVGAVISYAARFMAGGKPNQIISRARRAVGG